MEITRTSNLQKGATGLNIPVITSEHTAGLDFSAPAFAKWCDAVPVADTASAAKMIFLALTELNKTKIPPETKFALIDLMRRPLYYTVLGLRKHYINTNNLAKKQLMVAELAQTLQTEITHVYKTIVEDITNGKSSFDPKYNRIIEVSLYRIIYFSLRRLFRSYQVYNQIEPELWREIHLVYQISCQLKTQNIAIGTQYTVENFPVTVENCYKQSLILAATNPYQWRQLDQEAIMNALNYWTANVVIRPFHNDLKNRGVYTFDPSTDTCPTPPQLNPTSINQRSLVLDLNGLVKELNAQSVNITLANNERVTLKSKDGNEYVLSTACFNKLIHDWTKEVKPKDLRVKATGSTRATFGLVATHYNLNNRHKIDDKKQANLNYLQAEEEEVTATSNKAQEDIFPVHICFMYDQSPGGYQIMHYSETHPVIHAGDLIGLKFLTTEPTQAWEVGEIRWLQYRSAEKLSIGVKKLSQKPIPVIATLLRPDHSKQTSSFNCILIGEKSQIITPILPFKQGQEVVLENNLIVNKTITLTTQLSTSGTFKIFEYQDLNPKENTPNQDQIEVEIKEAPKEQTFDPQKVTTEFDDIWHSL